MKIGFTSVSVRMSKQQHFFAHKPQVRRQNAGYMAEEDDDEACDRYTKKSQIKDYSDSVYNQTNPSPNYSNNDHFSSDDDHEWMHVFDDRVRQIVEETLVENKMIRQKEDYVAKRVKYNTSSPSAESKTVDLTQMEVSK